MAKKNTPVLTHTEVLSYAIRTAYTDWRDLRDQVNAFEKHDAEFATKMQEARVAPARAKLEALYSLYRMETGTDYGLD